MDYGKIGSLNSDKSTSGHQCERIVSIPPPRRAQEKLYRQSEDYLSSAQLTNRLRQVAAGYLPNIPSTSIAAARGQGTEQLTRSGGTGLSV